MNYGLTGKDKLKTGCGSMTLIDKFVISIQVAEKNIANQLLERENRLVSAS